MSPRSTPIVIPTLKRLRGLVEMMCCKCLFMRIVSLIFERPSHLSYHAAGERTGKRPADHRRRPTRVMGHNLPTTFHRSLSRRYLLSAPPTKLKEEVCRPCGAIQSEGTSS